MTLVIMPMSTTIIVALHTRLYQKANILSQVVQAGLIGQTLINVVIHTCFDSGVKCLHEYFRCVDEYCILNCILKMI